MSSRIEIFQVFFLLESSLFCSICNTGDRRSIRTWNPASLRSSSEKGPSKLGVASPPTPPCSQGPRDRWSRERKKKEVIGRAGAFRQGETFLTEMEDTTETIETVNPGKVSCFMAHPVTPPVTSLENAQLLETGVLVGFFPHWI